MIAFMEIWKEMEKDTNVRMKGRRESAEALTYSKSAHLRSSITRYMAGLELLFKAISGDNNHYTACLL